MNLTIERSSESSRLRVDYRTTWQTEDEVQFVARLSPERLALYAPIVLEDRRRWDAGVDVERVKRCVLDCLAGQVAAEGAA